MRRAMHAAVDALAPAVRLAVEIIQVREGHSCPEALLHMADRALDLAFRLGRVWLAHPRRDPNRDHEIGKARIPPRFVLLHF